MHFPALCLLFPRASKVGKHSVSLQHLWSKSFLSLSKQAREVPGAAVGPTFLLPHPLVSVGSRAQIYPGVSSQSPLSTLGGRWAWAVLSPPSSWSLPGLSCSPSVSLPLGKGERRSLLSFTEQGHFYLCSLFPTTFVSPRCAKK